MARKTFFSFHYKPDCVRASQVRNMGVIEGNPSASDNDWETITKGGDEKIKKWINDQLSGRTCSIVLIGTNTADRKWINYEIEKSWNDNKGVLGIHIHGLKDFSGDQSSKGANPFSNFNVSTGGIKKPLSSIVQTYDPPYWDSKDVYKYIRENLEDWIEKAIQIRGNY